MNKIKMFVTRNYGKVMLAASALFLAGSAKAADISTTSEVSSAFSGLLGTLVYSIVNVIVAFFTANLPVIVILGVCISLVWYLVRKARGASRGK